MDADPLLTTKELAKWLRVTPQSIVNWRSSDGLPYIKLGRKVLFLESQVKEWLRNRVQVSRK